MTASTIIAAIQSRGCSTDDLRDAAHEAHHALVCKLRRPWHRDAVHDAIVTRCAGRMELLVGEELDARAVEWTVLERHSMPYDVDKWAAIAGMEATRVGVFMQLADWKRGIEARHGTARIEQFASAVMSLRRLRRARQVEVSP